MNCPYCESKEQQKQLELFSFSHVCRFCNGKKKITFNKYVAFNLSLLGDRYSLSAMEKDCEETIIECFKKYHKTRLPNIKSFEYYYDAFDDEESNFNCNDVRHFYINQFYYENFLYD